MAELDLIPEDYRLYLKATYFLKVAIVVYLILSTTIGGSYFMLNKKIDVLGKSISDFEAKKLLIAEQQQVLSELQKKKQRLDERIKVLYSLRDGPEAKKMFNVINSSLVEGIWFKRWKFKNDSELTKASLIENISNGYQIIFKDELKPNMVKAWRLNTFMEISGQAINHTKLASLVNNLITMEEINDVKILSTSRTKGMIDNVINYDLAITINNQQLNES